MLSQIHLQQGGKGRQRSRDQGGQSKPIRPELYSHNKGAQDKTAAKAALKEETTMTGRLNVDRVHCTCEHLPCRNGFSTDSRTKVEAGQGDKGNSRWKATW